MLDRIRTSLKAKLLILFLALDIAVIILVAAMSVQSKRAALRDVAENNLAVITTGLADKVDRFMSEKQDDLGAIALHYSLEGVGTTTSGQNTLLARYVEIHPYFYHINIINIKDIGTSSGTRPKTPGYDPDWYLPALNGKVVSSKMYISPLTDQPTLSLAAPVKDKEGRVISILTGNLKLEYLWDMVDEVQKENQKNRQSGYAYIIDRDGLLVAYPDRSRILSDLTRERDNLKLSAALKEMMSGRSGSSDYVYQGVNKVVVYAPCKGFGSYKSKGWSVAVTMPYDELFAPMKQLMTMYVLLFLATAMVAVYISIMMANYLVRPILALKDGASRIGAGNFDMRIQPPSTDEIGELANSFNRMAETLQARDKEISRHTAHISSMNRELEERQSELAEANEILTRTNEELVKLEKQKAEFMAMITHDIKSPLSTVIAYSDMILSGAIKEGDELRGAIGSVQASANKILNLVENYLVSTAIEAGKLQLTPQPLDINDFVEGEIQFFLPQMEKKGITFSFTKAEGLPKVVADRVQLDRALSNIVTNAVKFTPKSGSISIETSFSDHWVRVSVTDSGIGIPEDELDNMFNKYRRAKDTGRVDGQGLGLFISRAIVEAHGGGITVSSRPGQGSTFMITLPAKGSPGALTE